MSEFLKPQSPLSKDGVYFYPLTTEDQVIMDDGSRLSSTLRGVLEGAVYVGETIDSAVAPINADRLGGQLPSYYAPVTKLTPRNLLDNSDFTNPVNQRGKTQYSDRVYTIDRWYNNSHVEAITISVDSGCVELTNNAAQRNSIFQQTLEKLSPGVYTFAVYTNYGITVRTENVTGEDKDYPRCNINSDWWINFNTASGKTQVRIVNTTANASTIRLYWAALYEGEYTTETLPEYQPKGYGAELAECMRYYWHLKDLFRIRCNQVTTSIMDFLIVLPVPMRIKPTLVQYSEAKVYSQANNAANSGFALTIQCTEGAVQRGHMTIRATKSAHGLTDGWLELPANSYFTADL